MFLDVFMKTMKQMQDEQLNKCRFDGGWPRPFVGSFGIVQVARNQEEYDRMVKSEMLAWIIAIPGAFVLVGLLMWLIH